MRAVTLCALAAGALFLVTREEAAPPREEPPRRGGAVATVQARMAPQDAARFRELRDQGIRLVGWVAGNSSNHPIWPQVEGDVNEFYDYFVRLAPRGLSESEQAAEAAHTVALYWEWFEKGRARPFNERDNVSKMKRFIQLAEEVLEPARR